MYVREQLISFLTSLPHHEMCMLWDALDVAHRHLIYESTEEKLLLDQFMMSLWLATRAVDISDNQEKSNEA